MLERYILPAFWAPYLVNNDATGMDATERANVDDWREEFEVGHCVDCSPEPEFCKRHDARGFVPFACDCLTYTFEKKV